MPEKRLFEMKVSVDCTENNAGKFFANDLCYSNLSYADVVMLEGQLLALLDSLHKVGMEKAKAEK